jgi:surfeit locus 1 family protein
VPGLPAGGATVFEIPNNHLSYAGTWFGLAATLLVVFAVLVMRRRRS